MWQFVKYTLATIIGLFLFSFLGFILIIGIGSAMSSSESEFEVKENSVLKLNWNFFEYNYNGSNSWKIWVVLRGQLYGAPGLRMTKWRHFVFHQFGVPTDHIFWHTCRIFRHTCHISNFKILKIGRFRNTKSQKCLSEKKWISIQALVNRDFVRRDRLFRQTKLQKWISHTKGCKSWFHRM